MDMRDVNALKAWGRKVGRAGMSQAALSVMSDDKSYKGVMRTAGAMKAIAIAAQAPVNEETKKEEEQASPTQDVS